MKIFIIGLTVLFLSVAAKAECEPPKRPLTIKLSPTHEAARYQNYLIMCERFGGYLIDGQSMHLGARFSRPTKGYMLVPKSERGEHPQPIKGTTLIGAVVNDEGKTIEVTLIVSSGDKATDEEVVKTARRFHYAQPAKLDGKPVEFYETFLISAAGSSL